MAFVLCYYSLASDEKCIQLASSNLKGQFISYNFLASSSTMIAIANEVDVMKQIYKTMLQEFSKRQPAVC